VADDLDLERPLVRPERPGVRGEEDREGQREEEDREGVQAEVQLGADLGCGRIIASGVEALNMLVNLV
jgi:hypothetical protein